MVYSVPKSTHPSTYVRHFVGERTHRIAHVQSSDLALDHFDHGDQVRVSDRHDVDELRFDGRRNVVRIVRQRVILEPHLARLQRIIMIDVRHGGLIPVIGHEPARPHRVVPHVGLSATDAVAVVIVVVVVVRTKLNRSKQRVDLRLGAQVHGLRGRAPTVRQALHSGPAALFREHELVVCNIVSYIG